MRYARPVPVISVTENQDIDPAGDLVNVFELRYTLAGRPGVFTLTVPRSGDAVVAAQAEIAALEATVTGIYNLG